MLKKPDFGNYKNAQFSQFFVRFNQIISKYNLKELNLDTYALPLKENSNELKVLLFEQNGSIITSDINLLDEKRGTAVKGIKRALEGFTAHSKQEKIDAANDLLYIYRKIGAIDKLPYAEETAAINKLYEDFKSTKLHKEHLVTLDIQEWVQDLKTLNDEFEALYLKRIETNSRYYKSRKELRLLLIDLYRKFSKYLLANDTLNPLPEYKKIIRVVNELIQKTNDTSARRSSISSEETVTNETEEEEIIATVLSLEEKMT